MAETSTRVAMRRQCSRINADDFMKGFAIEARFDAGRNACSDNAAEMDGLCGSDCSLYCGTTTARRNCGLDCRLSLGFRVIVGSLKNRGAVAGEEVEISAGDRVPPHYGRVFQGSNPQISQEARLAQWVRPRGVSV